MSEDRCIPIIKSSGNSQMKVDSIKTIYKILSESGFHSLKENKILSPEGIDIKDGFVHLSTEPQLVTTSNRYFKGRNDIYLIEIDVEHLDPQSLIWEDSPGRDDSPFPHYYSPDIPLHGIKHCYHYYQKSEEWIREPVDFKNGE